MRENATWTVTPSILHVMKVVSYAAGVHMIPMCLVSQNVFVTMLLADDIIRVPVLTDMTFSQDTEELCVPVSFHTPQLISSVLLRCYVRRLSGSAFNSEVCSVEWYSHFSSLPHGSRIYRRHHSKSSSQQMTEQKFPPSNEAQQASCLRN